MSQTLKSITIAGQKFDVGGENVQLFHQAGEAVWGRLTPGQNLLQWFQANTAGLNLLNANQQIIYTDDQSATLYTQDYNSDYLPFILVATYLGIRQSVLPQAGEAIDGNPLYPQGIKLMYAHYERVNNVKEIVTFSIDAYGLGGTPYTYDKNFGEETLEEFLQSVVNDTQQNQYFVPKAISFTTVI